MKLVSGLFALLLLSGCVSQEVQDSESEQEIVETKIEHFLVPSQFLGFRVEYQSSNGALCHHEIEGTNLITHGLTSLEIAFSQQSHFYALSAYDQRTAFASQGSLSPLHLEEQDSVGSSFTNLSMVEGELRSLEAYAQKDLQLGDAGNFDVKIQCDADIQNLTVLKPELVEFLNLADFHSTVALDSAAVFAILDGAYQPGLQTGGVAYVYSMNGEALQSQVQFVGIEEEVSINAIAGELHRIEFDSLIDVRLNWVGSVEPFIVLAFY